MIAPPDLPLLPRSIPVIQTQEFKLGDLNLDATPRAQAGRVGITPADSAMLVLRICSLENFFDTSWCAASHKFPRGPFFWRMVVL